MSDADNPTKLEWIRLALARYEGPLTRYALRSSGSIVSGSNGPRSCPHVAGVSRHALPSQSSICPEYVIAEELSETFECQLACWLCIAGPAPGWFAG